MPLKIAVLGMSLHIKKKIYLMILIKKKIRSMIIKIEKEKIIWFIPPFCRPAIINVGKYFFKMIDKSTLNMIIYYIRYLIEKR